MSVISLPLNKSIDVLLVESNPIDAAAMLQDLENIVPSDRILWLEDGSQAEQFLKCEGIFAERTSKKAPEIIFLDLNLPSINVFLLLHQIRVHPKLENLSIILICSSKEEMQIIKTYDLNINGYALKPVNFIEHLKTFH